MTENELKEVLERSGVPFAYREFKEEQALPFGVFFLDRTNGFAADGVTYSHSSRYEVELYTEEKDPACEAALQAALTAAGIFWNKTTETALNEERVQFTTYEIEV